MKHKVIEGSNTSLKNGYTAKYFSHIFRMVFSHLSLKTKKIMLFTMIMFCLPLVLLSDNNSTFFESETIYDQKNLYFHKPISRKLTFSLVIVRKDKKIASSSLDAPDRQITTYARNGNLYNIVYPNGYTSTIELVKNRIEFIEYFSVNVEIYKDKKLLHKFSTNSSTYYDPRYPNCISDVGDGSSFDTGIIQINYDKKITSNIIDILKENKWSAFKTIYSSQLDKDDIELVGDEVFLRKELCNNNKCKVWVHVKEGEEFNAVSKINGLNNGVCATRIPSGAGGKIILIESIDEIDETSNPEEIIAYMELHPSAAGKEESNVDLALKKLQTANIVFNTPSSMIRYKTETIKLMLDATKDITDLLKELNATEHESAVVKYNSRMQATLIGENKNAFEITSILPETQVVTSITTTTWKWDVTPLELGEQKLHLALMVFLNTEGEKTAHIVKSFDRVIKVDVSYGDEVFLYIQDKDHWKWILVGLLFPFIGFLWKIIISKKEEE